MAIKTKLEDMEIGDMIACRYKAGGSFSELGTCVAPELPVAGSANPDGLFYFRKVDTGLCIADRVVQHSISWDTLNGLGLIQGGVTKLGRLNGVSIDSFSSQFNDSFSAKNAIDGDLASRWASASSSPSYIVIKLPTVSSARYISVSTQEVGSFSASFSIDGISYGSPVSATVAITYNPSITKETFIDIPNDFKFIKFNFNGCTTNCPTVCDISIYYYSCLIRSLSGGNSYLGENGKSSLVDKGLGVFPSNNEWDKYIVKSNLNGTITAGDDNVWHWENIYSICQDTTTFRPNIRMCRGYQPVNYVNNNSGYSEGVNTLLGFRPVLEYIEPKSKATTLFY